MKLISKNSTLKDTVCYCGTKMCATEKQDVVSTRPPQFGNRWLVDPFTNTFSLNTNACICHSLLHLIVLLFFSRHWKNQSGQSWTPFQPCEHIESVCSKSFCASIESFSPTKIFPFGKSASLFEGLLFSGAGTMKATAILRLSDFVTWEWGCARYQENDNGVDKVFCSSWRSICLHVRKAETLYCEEQSCFLVCNKSAVTNFAVELSCKKIFCITNL